MGEKYEAMEEVELEDNADDIEPGKKKIRCGVKMQKFIWSLVGLAMAGGILGFIALTTWLIAFPSITIPGLGSIPGLGEAQMTTKKALVEFYMATNGADWTNSTNWTKDDPCSNQWYGVQCEGLNITSINLDNNNLRGSITPNINGKFLPFLRSLILSRNMLTGSITENITTITNLQQLILKSNKLSGNVTASIAKLTSISTLLLSDNHGLGGNLSAIATLPNLIIFEATNCGFQGEIPAFSSNSLQVLALSNNSLSSSIPNSLGNQHLKTLYVDSNGLTGPLPEFLQTPWDDFSQFDIHNNYFLCPLPSWCSSDGNGLCEPCVPS